MTGRGSFLEIPLDPTQASDNRNGLVKHIYGQVGFECLPNFHYFAGRQQAEMGLARWISAFF